VRLQGGRALHVPLVSEQFTPDFEALSRALSPRTRLVIINFPHNPSGAVLSAADLDRLFECLRDSEAFVLSDEVYEHIVFDGTPHQSVLRHAGLRARSFVVGSFGKAYHATGWKVGWVAAPAPLSAELRKVHQFVTFSTSTAAQHALADMLASDSGHLQALAGFYQQKRDHFRRLLQGSKLRLLPVRGAYFQLVDYSALSSEADQVFAERLVREVGVASIPISGFYEKAPQTGLLRFCFAKQDATLERAAERLRGLTG
jgi:methionine aminotransferase